MPNIRKIIVRSSSASRCDEYFNKSVLIANSVDQLTQRFVFHKSCEYSHTLIHYLFALAKSQNVQSIRGHITRSAIKGHKWWNRQPDRQIKLNNQLKFVSFLNLNSKQTTKQSLIIVSFAYFFSLLLRTLFLRSLSLSRGLFMFHILCPSRGGAINQSTVELCKIQPPEQTNRLSLYIYTQYICDIIMYIDAVDWPTFVLKIICRLSECLFALWIQRLDAFCE